MDNRPTRSSHTQKESMSSKNGKHLSHKHIGRLHSICRVFHVFVTTDFGVVTNLAGSVKCCWHRRQTSWSPCCHATCQPTRNKSMPVWDYADRTQKQSSMSTSAWNMLIQASICWVNNFKAKQSQLPKIANVLFLRHQCLLLNTVHTDLCF